jgi:transcriptional antiterminator RfaH
MGQRDKWDSENGPYMCVRVRMYGPELLSHVSHLSRSFLINRLGRDKNGTMGQGAGQAVGKGARMDQGFHRTLDGNEPNRVAGSGGTWCADGLAGARQFAAGPDGLARTGAKALPVLPHWSDPSAPWICIEHRADAGARVRLDLRRSGFEVHWPREVLRIRGRDDVLRPFFPGYLFALPAATNASWQEVRQRGQLGVFVVGVKELGRPACPPPGFVLGLINRAGGAIDGVIPAPEDAIVRFRRDDPVTVLTGPLAGAQGLFREERGKRVAILLTLLGVEREVKVRADQLARVD